MPPGKHSFFFFFKSWKFRAKMWHYIPNVIIQSKILKSRETRRNKRDKKEYFKRVNFLRTIPYFICIIFQELTIFLYMN